MRATNQETMMYHTPNRLLPVACLVASFLAAPAAALEIIPRFTGGPFPGLSREMTGPDVSETPSPCKVLDTAAPIVDEKTAVCLAIEAWQRHLRDPVSLEIEVYALEAPFFNFLGAASTPLWWLAAPAGNPQQPDLGYAAMLHLLRVDNAHEQGSDPVVRQLPNHSQLSLRLPETLAADWLPTSVALTAPQLAAIGARAPQGLAANGAAMELATLPTVHGVIIINVGRRAMDLDPRDGTGIGPLTAGTWDAFDLAQPATVPVGFFPEIFDFVGLAGHEIGHVLGFSSAVDALNEDTSGLPRSEQVIDAMDLFRIEETAVGQISSSAEARAATRNLRSDGAGPLAPELGNHVFLHAFGPSGPSFVPLSSGPRGDGSQASHLRTSMVRVRNAQADLERLQWIEDRDRPCPPLLGLPADATCPTGTLMKPISVPHTPAVITRADLVVLDLTGWDVDYTGSLDPAGTGGDPVIDLGDLAGIAGLEVRGRVLTIED